MVEGQLLRESSSPTAGFQSVELGNRGGECDLTIRVYVPGGQLQQCARLTSMIAIGELPDYHTSGRQAPTLNPRAVRPNGDSRTGFQHASTSTCMTDDPGPSELCLCVYGCEFLTITKQRTGLTLPEVCFSAVQYIAVGSQPAIFLELP
jgi:hypothetical protein